MKGPLYRTKEQKDFADSAMQLIINDPEFESYYRDFIYVDGVRYRIYIQRDLDVEEIKDE